MFATPIGYLIDEEGIILRDVAVGVGPILRSPRNRQPHPPTMPRRFWLTESRREPLAKILAFRNSYDPQSLSYSEKVHVHVTSI
jgi:hypothetical protein